jgi:hypothetical protein
VPKRYECACNAFIALIPALTLALVTTSLLWALTGWAGGFLIACAADGSCLGGRP